MTDTAPMPPAPTAAEAQAELEEIGAWLADFQQRQAQVQQVTVRAAYLQGVLAERPPEPAPPNREARRAKGPTKKAPARKRT